MYTTDPNEGLKQENPLARNVTAFGPGIMTPCTLCPEVPTFESKNV